MFRARGFVISGLVVGILASAEEEEAGLDVSEIGTHAYREFSKSSYLPAE